MKIVKIKQSDLNRLINEQVGGTSTVDLGKKIFDVGKSTVNYVKSKFGDKEQKTSQKVDIKPFSIDNLKAEINKLGIVYPDIVLAQAKWESTHFTSEIFYDNNNLFGMKLAKIRPTTAIGKHKLHGNHAAYNNWQDSVKDYKLWQDSNGMSKLPKELYLNRLSDIYCPPPDCPKGQYTKNIKSMLK
jgi:hypothetical protein